MNINEFKGAYVLVGLNQGEVARLMETNQTTLHNRLEKETLTQSDMRKLCKILKIKDADTFFRVFFGENILYHGTDRAV